MVLVSDKPSGDIDILQTQFSHREGYETRRIGPYAMPLDEHSKSRHREGEVGVEICPDSVHHLLAVADHDQHRKHRLHQDAVLPLPALTQFKVGGIALGGMETGIAQDHHASIALANEPLKGMIGNSGCGTVPPRHEAIL
jgi:hypothetical protein